MCEQSQAEAATRGFRGMQYNLVAPMNGGAIRLRKNHGFEIVGTLPGAFRHTELGFVDAFVMFKPIEAEQVNE